MKPTQEAWINAVKSCGQSLIDNAESIAGDFDYRTDTEIIINLRPKELVRISVIAKYVPKDINDTSKPASTIPSWEGKCQHLSFCIDPEEGDNDNDINKQGQN